MPNLWFFNLPSLNWKVTFFSCLWCAHLWGLSFAVCAVAFLDDFCFFFIFRSCLWVSSYFDVSCIHTNHLHRSTQFTVVFDNFFFIWIFLFGGSFKKKKNSTIRYTFDVLFVLSIEHNICWTGHRLRFHDLKMFILTAQIF